MVDELKWKYGPDETDWEALDAEQAGADAQLVREFEGAERNVAEGVAVEENACATLRALAQKLPPRRKAHWAAEFERIGIREPAPVAVPAANKPAKSGTKKQED